MQDLDIQYTVGVATGVLTVFMSVGENNSDGAAGFLDLINALVDKSDPPHVISTSHGFNEDELSSSLAKFVILSFMTP